MKNMRDWERMSVHLTSEDFTDETSYYQMGRPPFRLDIIMGLKGIDFESAWGNRVVVSLEDITLPFISKKDLIRAKEISGRPQDLIDAENLKKASG